MPKGERTKRDDSHLPHGMERDRKAFELRMQHKSLRHIRETIGFKDNTQVKAAVARELKRIRDESYGDLVAMEVERLNALREAVWSEAKAGSIKHIKSWLELSSRLADLLGLDAPKNLNISIPQLDEQIQAEFDRVTGVTSRLALMDGSGEDGSAGALEDDAVEGEYEVISQ